MKNVVKPAASSVTKYSIPSALQEENPNLVKFIDYYYDWMSQDGFPLDLIQNLIEYRDINTTITAYAQLITRQFMEFIPVTAPINYQLVSTHIKEFYNTKGTLPSYNFIFNILFGEHATIVWNSDKVFKPSYASSSRDAVMYVYSTPAWPTTVEGVQIVQTYPSNASAMIESVIPTFINNKVINYVVINPDSVSGTFVPYSSVSVLPNTIDRSWTYVDTYYSAISYSAGSLMVSTASEVSRSYPNLVVRQIGSNFRGVVTSLSTRVTLPGQTNLTFALSNVTGTFGTGDIYMVTAAIEPTHFTKADYIEGMVSPMITDVQITNGGSLNSTGEVVSYNGGGTSGSPFTIRIGNIGGGAVEFIDISNSGGYGYSVGDPLIVDTSISQGSGLVAVVGTVDGYGATVEPTLELDGFQIANGGSAYAVGDQIILTDGVYPNEKYPTIFAVSTINNTLALHDIRVTTGGYGYQYAKIALKDNVLNALVSSFAGTASIVGGVINSIAVTSYPTLTNSNVSVLINGAGATATATTSGGVVNSIVIGTGGFNYVNPVVTINSTTQPSKLAYFTVTTNASGTITAINIDSGGAGYSSTVTVTITEKWGAGAAATPYVNNTTGPITGLTITQRGDYTSLPTCFNPPYISNSSLGSGLVLNLKYRLKSLDAGLPGEHFSGVSVDTTDGLGKGAVIVPIIEDGVVQVVNIGTAGSGYTFAHIEIVGTGSGFSGQVVLSGGGVASVTITNRGHGYSNTDSVVITGDGINAAATITVSNGSVTEFDILNGGVNYAYDTTVSYVMDPVLYPSAVAGTFTPVISNGNIKSITINSTGSGYVSNQTNRLKLEDSTYLLYDANTNLDYDSPYNLPLITSGTPARLMIDWAATGSIVSGTIIAGGEGYFDPSEVPSLEVYVVSSTGVGAEVVPILELGKIFAFNILHAGSGYQSTDTAYIYGGGGAGAVITPVFYNGKLVDIIINNPGSGYRYGSITLVSGDGTDADIYPIVNTSITDVVIANGGSNYVNPTINVTDATGSGAILIPTTNSNGSITSVRIVSGGTKYTNPSLSVTGGGTNAVLTAVMKRNIEDIQIVDAGENYTNASVFVTGDGEDADIDVNLEHHGSIANPRLYVQGTGYVSTPNFIFSEVVNDGTVTSVKILNGGQNFISPPALSLADKYYQGNLIASGANFYCTGSNIGSVRDVTFTSFGGDWFEAPKIQFPINVIVLNNENFIIGETVTIERFPYTQAPDPLLDVFDILVENGDTLWGEFKLDPLAQEDNFFLFCEDGSYIDTEDVGDIEWEHLEIELPNGTDVAWHDPGPSATVSSIDFSKNLVKLTHATESYIFITEDGAEIHSESEIPLVDQDSNGFYIGDVIVGTQSKVKTPITWFSRTSGDPITSGLGMTKKHLDDFVGIVGHPFSKIHDGLRIQNYAYVINTGLSIDTYKDVITQTVHPAGYAMYGDVLIDTFSSAFPVAVPYSFGIKGAASSFQTTLTIQNMFFDLSLHHHKNLSYYGSMPTFWYTTQAGVFADYTFENYDPQSSAFILDVSPLCADEPWMAITTTLTATATTGSDILTGITSTSGVHLGYRVMAYDSNGASIFRENEFKLEDGTYLLNEDTTHIDTDEPMVTVSAFTNTTLTASKIAKTTGTVTAVVQNIPVMLVKTHYVGTAQAGASSSLTLASNASTVQDIYKGMIVLITGGTGAGQERNVVTSRKNYLSYSQAFNNAYWTKNQCTIAANATTAPDGTLTADKIVSNLYTGRISVYAVPSVATGVKKAYSLYLKAAEWQYAVIFIDQTQLVEGSYYGSSVALDLVAGTSSNPSVVSIVAVGGGWFRATIAGTPTSTFLKTTVCPINALGVGVNAIVGDGVSGIYIWGAQLEDGSAATEYIHTEANPAVGVAVDTPWTTVPDATSVYDVVSQI